MPHRGRTVDEAVVCGEPDVFVWSDEEVANLGGCEIYRGSIGFGQFTNRAPLASLRVIEGSIGAGGYDLTVENLDGLERLESVGEFRFLGDGLRDLSGVRNLQRVDGFLRLDSLPNLPSLKGLENLRVVGGMMSMGGNPMLESLDGLAGLERVEGDLHITGNTLVPAAEVDALLARIEVGGKVIRD
jgi:hypothetical protein